MVRQPGPSQYGLALDLGRRPSAGPDQLPVLHSRMHPLALRWDGLVHGLPYYQAESFYVTACQKLVARSPGPSRVYRSLYNTVVPYLLHSGRGDGLVLEQVDCIDCIMRRIP